MELILDNIYKSYGSLPVLSGVSMKIASPDICCLMAPSGTGKTTLFRLIMGLEKPDSGTICPAPEQIRFSAVFQEDRLIPEFSLVMWPWPAAVPKPSLFRELARLLPRKRSSVRSLL
ncbi:MAG: ATP-binding cassette domain-containing protein [[Clostridium] symbiosum]